MDYVGFSFDRKEKSAIDCGVFMSHFGFVEVYLYRYTNVVEGIKNNANFTFGLRVCNHIGLQIGGVCETRASSVAEASITCLLEKGGKK